MSDAGGLTPARPGPPPNPVTETFWRGLDEGRLLLQQCSACGARQHYPRAVCSVCWSADLAWVQSVGAGTVWTWTVVHRPGHPAWASDAPYAVLVVELDEGPRLVTSYDGAPDELRIGLRVVVGTESRGSFSVAVARPYVESRP